MKISLSIPLYILQRTFWTILKPRFPADASCGHADKCKKPLASISINRGKYLFLPSFTHKRQVIWQYGMHTDPVFRRIDLIFKLTGEVFEPAWNSYTRERFTVTKHLNQRLAHGHIAGIIMIPRYSTV